MNFYCDKFKNTRKKQRYTAIDFCKIMGVARTTLWEWESGKRIPSEAVIRRLAEILKIDVSSISDLKEMFKVADADFSGARAAVGSLFTKSVKQREAKFQNIISEIQNLKGELDQAAVIINALLTTMHTMFYIKDVNLKYVIANSNFLLNLSLSEDFVSKGHDDTTFFSAKDAKINTMQDKEVLYTKKSIITQEGYIPGTRRKKWGLISKIPIMDSHNNAVGIVGTFLDITERKKTTEIRRLLEIALNHASYVVWLLHPYPNYKLFYVSESVKQLYGYSAEKFTENKNLWLDKCVHPDDRMKLENEWLAGKISELSEKRIFRIISPGGKIKIIESILVDTEINATVAYIEKDVSSFESEKEIEIKRDIADALTKEGVDDIIIEKVTGVKKYI
jgi:transcriptional regulator with XRE-family HTH domain